MAPAKLQYHGRLIPENPDQSSFEKITQDYQAILVNSLQAILDRYDRQPNYPWIDTKLSLITGQDFPNDDPLRGCQTIYAWIQGRALEALAGHAQWLQNNPHLPQTQKLLTRINTTLRQVLDQLYNAYQKNGRHLFFFLDTQGRAFTLKQNGSRELITLNQHSPYNFSDIFCAKGIYAAAQYLNDSHLITVAKEYCLKTAQAVFDQNFTTDQQQLDPKNIVQHIPGRHSQGPYMIQIAAATLLTRFEKNHQSVQLGLKFISHILDRHVNLDNRWPQLKPFELVEFLNDHNEPYLEHNRIVSDPGHALELIGLALKFTSTARQLPNLDQQQKNQINRIEQLLPKIFRPAFSNGFQSTPGGICKAFDLIARQPINTDMPWWSLPETIRAALACWKIAHNPDEKKYFLNAFAVCHNAFITHFIKPELNLMAVQTRAADGSTVDVIPATPDADPGYHTGLSLIDALYNLNTNK